jgi:hypothetical protein
MSNKFKDMNFSSLYKDRDKSYFEDLDRLFKIHNINLPDILTNYMAFVRRREFSQTLAYYELFKMVKTLPGSIVELGVYLGNGLFTWSKLLETFFPAVRGKKVYGFDCFDGYQSSNSIEKISIDYIKQFHPSGFRIDETLIKELIRINESDNLIMGAERVILYSGDVKTTIDEFITHNPGVRINLMMLDMNLYEPTKLALEKLFHLVCTGGIICFRGYGVKPWEGESMVVDEFLKENKIKLQSFDFSPFPSSYIIKD